MSLRGDAEFALCVATPQYPRKLDIPPKAKLVGMDPTGSAKPYALATVPSPSGFIPLEAAVVLIGTFFGPYLCAA